MHIYMRIRYIKINNNHWKLLSFLYSNVFILNIINIYVMFAMDTCDESFVIIKEISYDLPWVVLSWKEYCMNVYVKTKRTFDIGTICWNLYYNCLNYFFWKRKKKKCWFRHYVIVFDIIFWNWWADIQICRYPHPWKYVVKLLYVPNIKLFSQYVR